MLELRLQRLVHPRKNRHQRLLHPRKKKRQQRESGLPKEHLPLMEESLQLPVSRWPANLQQPEQQLVVHQLLQRLGQAHGRLVG